VKLLKVILVLLVFLVNLLFVQPSWADRPKLDENKDYQELTTQLDSFLKAKTDNTLPEGISSADELDLIITQLQYQKYIVENSEGVGMCRNESGGAIAVYGPKRISEKSEVILSHQMCHRLTFCIKSSDRCSKKALGTIICQ
jgi:hypothetical protein